MKVTRMKITPSERKKIKEQIKKFNTPRRRKLILDCNLFHLEFPAINIQQVLKVHKFDFAN